MIRPRELVVAQAGGASLLPVGARPDSVTLSYGLGRIGVDQILAGGFDEVSLMARDLVTFDGNVDLGLRRAINLYEGALGNTRAGATVRLAAPYVLLSGRTSLLPVDAASAGIRLAGRMAGVRARRRRAARR